MSETGTKQPDSDPLTDLVLKVLRGQRCYAIQGNEWYGWWTGRVSTERQLLVTFGGRATYVSRWQQITESQLADPRFGQPSLYLALFDPAGKLHEVRTRPAPLRIDPAKGAPNGVGPGFDVGELEAYLRAEFGEFRRETIRVVPFLIEPIGFELRPLPWYLIDYAQKWPDDPDDREDARLEVQQWIDEGCSVILYGNDYWLDGDGEVNSS